MTIPIFVINLKEDKDRWRSISDQIIALGLPFSRFDAYRGENIPERWRHQFFPFSNKCDPLSTPLRLLTNGEIGCYASHLSCMNMFLEGNYPAATILEDDIIIDSRISDLFSNVDKLPINWDILHLSGRPKSAFISLDNITPDFELVQFSRIPTGSWGYIVSRSGAQKLIRQKQGDLRRFPYDIEVKNGYIRKLNVYGCLPNPVLLNSGFPSAIDRIDRGRRKYRNHKSSVNMLIFRCYFNFRTLTIKLWLRCFFRNVYVHIWRRINRKNFPLDKLRVKKVPPNHHARGADLFL